MVSSVLGPLTSPKVRFLSPHSPRVADCLVHRVGTVQGSSETVPTVADNLKAQGVIDVEALGMFYPPYAEKISGSISFGGPDSSKYTGEMTFQCVLRPTPLLR